MPDGFSTLTLALVKTDLVPALNGNDQYTVFAPTNEAFDAAAAELPQGFANGEELVLGLPKDVLADILLYHVLPGVVLAGDLDEANVTVTMANEDDVSIEDTTPGAGVSPAITDDLERVTNVVLADVLASNGVIHAIDNVLLPPVEEEVVSIYETAVNNGLTSLVAAIDKAGLKHILSSDRFQLTVFAPTNEAFDIAAQDALKDDEATGADLVNALSSWQLRRILLNHVVYGELFSEDVLERNRFFTFAWGRLYFDADSFSLTSRNGKGTLLGGDFLDIDATNGVVHVIDGVLLP